MAQEHKTAAPPRQTQPVARPPTTKPNRYLTVLVIASIAVVVVGMILLKQQPSDAVALSSTQAGSPASYVRYLPM